MEELNNKSLTTIHLESKFYEIPDSMDVIPDEDCFPFDIIDNILSTSTEVVYIMDFQKRCFHYIPDHSLFLCGYSREEVMKWGYDFYSKTVHPKDLSKLIDVYRIILQILCSRDEQIGILGKKQVSDINYFSFTLRIMEYPQMRDYPSYLLVHHKLSPIFIKGQIRFGLCRLAYSVVSDSGNLRIYYKKTSDFDEYFSSAHKWKKQKTEQLSAQEIMILRYAQYGMSGEQIANELSMKISTLHHAKTELFTKLNVENLRQAVIYAASHLMIFDPILIIPNTVKKSNCKKRRYNKLTPENLQRIQAGLDNGQFIRYTARKEGVSEGCIRKAIKDGRLIKKSNTYT